MLNFKQNLIKENLDTPSYTIDFALSPDLEKIWIVELNNPVRNNLPFYLFQS